jgi:hypothetical protein
VLIAQRPTLKEIEESDMNPISASEKQVIALDARFVIKKKKDHKI